jgi:hypothetical protein
MNEDELLRKLHELNSQMASLRYRYYELGTTNRSLAMKLSGYRALAPERFPEELVKRMEFYIFWERKPASSES